MFLRQYKCFRERELAFIIDLVPDDDRADLLFRYAKQ